LRVWDKDEAMSVVGQLDSAATYYITRITFQSTFAFCWMFLFPVEPIHEGPLWTR